MSRRDGFEFSIRPAGAGWAWATYDKDGETLVEGAAATRAQAAACVIRAIASRKGTGEERTPPRTAAERETEERRR